MQLQQLVVAGDLPCSREEAATLAGIQLHLDETWPEEEAESGHTDDDQELEKDTLLKVRTETLKGQRDLGESAKGHGERLRW